MRPRDLKQWVCWRSEARERGGKPTKVPYSPATGSRARSDDPNTWGSLAEARGAADRDSYDGIGFVFTEGDPFCGVDLDGCVELETGEIEPWAAEILDELDSYTELSPSGEGLHVLVRAKLPEGGRRKGRIEMYDRGRFFTITGHHLDGTPRQVENRQEKLVALHARLFRSSPGALDEQGASEKSGVAPASPGLSDAEILARAMRAANGERFVRLWDGDRSGYTSDSEADLALCSMLAFWAGPDEDRIAGLFARSGLVREKWNREDYRKRTITRALAQQGWRPSSTRRARTGWHRRAAGHRNLGASTRPFPPRRRSPRRPRSRWRLCPPLVVPSSLRRSRPWDAPPSSWPSPCSPSSVAPSAPAA